LGAFLLPRVASAAEGNAPARRAKSVIVLLLEGGMSHIETWDPKPNGPSAIRGEYQPIRTSNPDLIIGEHMPLLAQQAHRYNVIRSVYSAARNHSPGLHWTLTGYDNPAAGINGQLVNAHPSIGSIVAHELGAVTEAGIPNFVAIPNRTQLGGRVNFNGAMHLGTSFEAFDSGATPATAKAPYVLPAGLTLPNDINLGRLEHRRSFLQEIDRLSDVRDRAAGTQQLSDYQTQAFDLLLGSKGRAAFDLNSEPAEVRERYGSSINGQGTLLARRLVEAGVNYVLVNYSRNNSWDTHRDNFNRLKKTLLPPMDQAVSTLLVDLDERGMLDETLVVMMGEMGRTPTINKNNGRDHWPDVYSVLMAGGGLTRGQVLGSSTRGGEQPGTRPVHVQEVLATVYQQLGIDPALAITDRQGRPASILPEAHPVRELIQG
jgi:hypothetical protein